MNEGSAEFQPLSGFRGHSSGKKCAFILLGGFGGPGVKHIVHAVIRGAFVYLL